MKTNKLAFYNPSHITKQSGPEVWLANMLPLLKRRGYEITLIQTRYEYKERNENITEKIRESATTLTMGYYSIPLSMSPMPNIKGLKNFLRSDFDLLYIFNGYAFHDLLATIVSKIKAKKLIYGVHAPIYTGYYLHDIYQTVISKRLIKLAYKVHTLNKTDLDSIKKINNKVCVIPSGVGQNFLDVNLEQRLSLTNFNICYTGRLDEQKNIPKLLALTKHLDKHKGSNINVYIIGDGAYKEDVEKHAKEQSNLIFLGPKPNNELPEIYKNMHLFVNLSRYETFCQTILEACATGMPCMSTPVEGIVKDYGEEFLYKTIDAQAGISKAANDIIELSRIFFNQKDKYLAMCSRAKNFAKKFSWLNIAEKFEKYMLE